jgi:ABC-type transport system involved in multi-copper enzyme maturation permease subunit
MRGAWVIGGCTLVEALRNRVLYIALLFVFLLALFSMAAASVSLNAQARLITDVGLATASALGGLVALALSIASFSAELARRTAYTVLLRPLPRWQFVVGKFLGVAATMTLIAGLCGGVTRITLALHDASPAPGFWWAVWLCAIELTVVSALGTLACTIATPALAATYSLGVWVAGSFSTDIHAFAAGFHRRGDALIGHAIDLGYYLLPRLEALSLRREVANVLPVPDGAVALATVYGGAYAAAVLALACIAFSHHKKF